MIKYPANRVELIAKDVVTKMLSLVLGESDSFKYEDKVKECVLYFNKIYHEDPDKVYRILITEYQISKFFVEYIASLNGFLDFLKTPENIELIKSNNTVKTKEVMAAEPTNSTFNELNFRNACFKALKFYTAKGNTFNEALQQVTDNISKADASYAGKNKQDVVLALAHKYFEVIEGMKKEPMKNILNLVKLLSPEEVAQLKAKL